MQAQLGSLLRRHFSECPEGAHERVLDDLLGILAISGHAQGETVEPSLKLIDDLLEAFG